MFQAGVVQIHLTAGNNLGYVFKPHTNSNVRIFSVGIQPDMSGGIQHTCYDTTGFWSRLYTKDSHNVYLP